MYTPFAYIYNPGKASKKNCIGIPGQIGVKGLPGFLPLAQYQPPGCVIARIIEFRILKQYLRNANVRCCVVRGLVPNMHNVQVQGSRPTLYYFLGKVGREGAAC